MQILVATFCLSLGFLASCQAVTTERAERELAPYRCSTLEPIEDRYIVVVVDGADPELIANEVVEAHGGEVHYVYRVALNGFSATLTDEGFDALRRHPEVEYIECDGRVYLD